MTWRCPTCKKTADIGASGASFPFCSERCKLIDLGRWLTDAYQIPVDPVDDGEDETTPDVWPDPNLRKHRS